MNLFHNHPIKGPGLCQVKHQDVDRDCPFGDLTSNHYSSFEEAQKAHEKALSQSYGLSTAVVALDLDNTFVNFTDGFRNSLANRYSLSSREALARFPDPVNYSFRDWFGSSESFLKHLKWSEQRGLYRNLKPFRGAVKAVKGMLKSKKIELKVVTARSPEWNKDTAANLRSLGLPPLEITNLHDKVNFPAHVFLDDKDSFAETIYSGRHVTDDGIVKTVIMKEAGYNKHLDPEKNWSDIAKQLNHTVERLTERRKTLAF